MEIVVTFDPGKNTGWSKWVDGVLVTCGCCTNLYDLVTQLAKFRGADLFIVEAFIGRAFTEDEKTAIRRIGVIEGFAKYESIEYREQAPNVRKGYVNFVSLFSTQWEKVSSETRRHAKDAIAHGIRYHAKEVPGWQQQYLTYLHLKGLENLED